ncbi:GNAT family N-acetyltransferase [Clostridium intestinale]|uniref:Acetyltransferase n=1 Tax=Clostridium intestinale URNW TaxID=1294142 RepID=U2PXC3_9CLOT|nr:GNAT family N-acetyltransferase [Clostridium intestinale]ERK28459.1 acetyltransferase [Clostridium intestinale URNW]
MIVKKSGILEKKLIKEIRKIEKVCKKNDNIIRDINLDSSLNFNQKMNHTFLYYSDNKTLIGFLYMFVPTSEEAEIQGYILPKYRGKGYFKELLKEAENELREYDVDEILFVLEFNPESAKGIDAEYEFTEYSMEYVGNLNEIESTEHSDIKILEAIDEDLEELVEISKRSFGESEEEAKGYIMKSLKADNRIQYKVIYKKECIGLAGVYIEETEATIFGFGILPEYRGSGLGKQVLKLILIELRHKNVDEILIDVDSNNEVAFELYKKMGFDIEVAFDYYRRKI